MHILPQNIIFMENDLIFWINQFLDENRYPMAIKYTYLVANCTKKEAKEYVDKIKWKRLLSNNFKRGKE